MREVWFYFKTTDHKRMRLIFPHKRTMYPSVEGCSCSWVTFWEINYEINALPFSSYTLVWRCYFPLTEPNQKATAEPSADPAQPDHAWEQCETKKWGPPTDCDLVTCLLLWQNTMAIYRKKDWSPSPSWWGARQQEAENSHLNPQIGSLNIARDRRRHLKPWSPSSWSLAIL